MSSTVYHIFYCRYKEDIMKTLSTNYFYEFNVYLVSTLYIILDQR